MLKNFKVLSPDDCGLTDHLRFANDIDHVEHRIPHDEVQVDIREHRTGRCAIGHGCAVPLKRVSHAIVL
jgi:hypothetical protein